MQPMKKPVLGVLCAYNFFKKNLGVPLGSGLRVECMLLKAAVMWVSLESGVKSQCVVQLVLNAWCDYGVLLVNL